MITTQFIDFCKELILSMMGFLLIAGFCVNTLNRVAMVFIDGKNISISVYEIDNAIERACYALNNGDDTAIVMCGHESTSLEIVRLERHTPETLADVFAERLDSEMNACCAMWPSEDVDRVVFVGSNAVAYYLGLRLHNKHWPGAKFSYTKRPVSGRCEAPPTH